MAQTFCLVRRISGNYSIEFVRDFGDKGTSLKEHLINVEKIESCEEKEPTCRLIRRIQTQKCHDLTEQGAPGCDCSAYYQNTGSLKCKTCDHIHKPLNSYEDLEGLPCFLILVDNGRHISKDSPLYGSEVAQH